MFTGQKCLPFAYLFINKCPGTWQKRTKAAERNLSDMHEANTRNVRTACYWFDYVRYVLAASNKIPMTGTNINGMMAMS